MKLSLIVSVYINSCIFIYIETASAEESKFNYIYIKFVTPEVTLSCLYLPVTSSRMFVLMLLQNHHPKFGSFRFSKIKPIRKKKSIYLFIFTLFTFFFSSRIFGGFYIIRPSIDKLNFLGNAALGKRAQALCFAGKTRNWNKTKLKGSLWFQVPRGGG